MTFFHKSSIPSHRYFNKSVHPSHTYFHKSTEAGVKHHHHDAYDYTDKESKKVSPLEKHHRRH